MERRKFPREFFTQIGRSGGRKGGLARRRWAKPFRVESARLAGWCRAHSLTSEELAEQMRRVRMAKKLKQSSNPLVAAEPLVEFDPMAAVEHAENRDERRAVVVDEQERSSDLAGAEELLQNVELDDDGGFSILPSPW